MRIHKCSVLYAMKSLSILRFNIQYKTACAFDVIEHISDHKKAMEELNRVVKKDGLILVTVPAFQFLWSRHDEINYHFRRYTKKAVNKLGIISGLSLLYSTYFNFFLFFPVFAARMFGKIKLQNSKKSDFEKFQINPSDNKILHAVFKLEKRILFPLKFPFGVSVFSAFIK